MVGKIAADAGDESSDDWGPFSEELYYELHKLAKRVMRGQRRDWTLFTTDLLHQACEKVFGRQRLEDLDRNYILAKVAAAMRSIVIDHARRNGRMKRLPPGARVPLEDIRSELELRAIDALALEEVLAELAKVDPDMARAVDLHFYAGLTMAETAEVNGMPQRTFERRWPTTVTWLRARLG